MNTREQHRKIPHVSGVLLLEVNPELCTVDPGAAEDGPGPVMLAVHDGQQPLAEVLGGKRAGFAAPRRSAVSRSSSRAAPSNGEHWDPAHSRLILDRSFPRSRDGVLWASDHYGVLTDFEAPPPPRRRAAAP